MQTVGPGSSGREGARRTRLGQPLMVVVLVMVARTATPARAADVLFRRNGRAANMGWNCSGSGAMRPMLPRIPGPVLFAIKRLVHAAHPAKVLVKLQKDMEHVLRS